MVKELIKKSKGQGASTKNYLSYIVLLMSIMSMPCFLLLTGCASTSDLDVTKSDLNQLKGDTLQFKKDTTELRSDIRTLKDQISGTVKEETFNAIRESQTSLLTQVTEVSKDLQVLRGRFDEYKFFIDKALKESSVEKEVLRSQISSLELRIKELNERLEKLTEAKTAAPAQKSVSEGEDSTGKTNKTTEKTEETKKTAEDPAKVYEAAYNTFKDNKYKEAREKFTDFIEKFPKDDLAGNARFWIGETHYAEKDFESAILAYEAMLKDFPNGKKAPGAMLKQGLSFIEIGDKKTAKVIFDRLIEKYPDSQEADAAKKKKAEIDKKPARKTRSGSKSMG